MYLLKNTQLWRKRKVRLPQTKFPLEKEKRGRLPKHTTNTIELRRTTVDKEDNSSLQNPDYLQLTSGFFNVLNSRIPQTYNLESYPHI